MKIQGFAPTVFVSRSFAQGWWTDLCAAAEDDSDDGRRREAVFAGCFAETVLFEWVRDVVLTDLRTKGLDLKRDGQHERGVEFKRRGEIQNLMEVFFPGKDGLLVRWITVPARAFDAMEQSDYPSYYNPDSGDFERMRELSEWIDLDRVIRLRNGFVHAKASRPKSTAIDPKHHPVPDQFALAALPAGWACSVVEGVTRRLYVDWGSGEPDWMRR